MVGCIFRAGNCSGYMFCCVEWKEVNSCGFGLNCFIVVGVYNFGKRIVWPEGCLNTLWIVEVFLELFCLV